jgi:hypothetical protein
LVFLGLTACNRQTSLSEGVLSAADGSFTLYTYNDKERNGSSWIRMTQTGEDAALSFSGRVTTRFPYGFAGIVLIPDEALLAAIRSKAIGVTLHISGDGKNYRFSIDADNITDGNTFGREFGAPQTVSEITFMVDSLRPEAWGDSRVFDPALIKNFKIQTIGQPIADFAFRVHGIKCIYREE